MAKKPERVQCRKCRELELATDCRFSDEGTTDEAAVCRWCLENDAGGEQPDPATLGRTLAQRDPVPGQLVIPQPMPRKARP